MPKYLLMSSWACVWGPWAYSARHISTVRNWVVKNPVALFTDLVLLWKLTPSVKLLWFVCLFFVYVMVKSRVMVDGKLADSNCKAGISRIREQKCHGKNMISWSIATSLKYDQKKKCHNVSAVDVLWLCSVNLLQWNSETRHSTLGLLNT